MTIEEELCGGVQIMAIAGRLDSTTSSILDVALLRGLESSAAVLLDFSAVPYVSSAGLRVLLKGAKIAQGTGRRLMLVAVAPQVAEVFEISGCTRLFDIHADRLAAVAAATA